MVSEARTLMIELQSSGASEGKGSPADSLPPKFHSSEDSSPDADNKGGKDAKKEASKKDSKKDKKEDKPTKKDKSQQKKTKKEKKKKTKRDDDDENADDVPDAEHNPVRDHDDDDDPEDQEDLEGLDELLEGGANQPPAMKKPSARGSNMKRPSKKRNTEAWSTCKLSVNRHLLYRLFSDPNPLLG